MDLNFYSDLTDGTGPHGDPEFLDPGSFNGYDNKVTDSEIDLTSDLCVCLCVVLYGKLTDSHMHSESCTITILQQHIRAWVNM